jgi:hypothetical protein
LLGSSSGRHRTVIYRIVSATNSEDREGRRVAVVEPKLLRFKMLQVPARLSRSGRRRQLRLPCHWPWAGQILEAFHRIMIIPAPT